MEPRVRNSVRPAADQLAQAARGSARGPGSGGDPCVDLLGPVGPPLVSRRRAPPSRSRGSRRHARHAGRYGDLLGSRWNVDGCRPEHAGLLPGQGRAAGRRGGQRRRRPPLPRPRPSDRARRPGRRRRDRGRLPERGSVSGEPRRCGRRPSSEPLRPALARASVSRWPAERQAEAAPRLHRGQPRWAAFDRRTRRRRGAERVALEGGVSPNGGDSVHRYVVRRRVERAQALLRDESLPLIEVVLAAGFAHQSHLAQEMRSVLGVSPAALRRGGACTDTAQLSALRVASCGIPPSDARTVPDPEKTRRSRRTSPDGCR